MTEKEAAYYFSTGQYTHAESIYRELIKTSSGPEDRIHYNDLIVNCEKYRKHYFNLSPGEVIVPVVNQKDLKGSFIVLKVIKERSRTPDNFILQFKKAANKTEHLLMEYLSQMMVLDWGWEDYSIILKPIPNDNQQYKQYIEAIAGSSMEVGMVIAILSFLVNKKIDCDKAFTGMLSDGVGDLNIIQVDYLPQKEKILDEDPYIVKKLFVPMNSTENSNTIAAGSLSEIVEQVFQDFRANIYNIRPFIGKRRIYADEVKRVSGESIIKFYHENLVDTDGVRLPLFFAKVTSMLENKPYGIILDGLKASYLAPMLCSMSEVTNHISNYLAVRSGSEQKAFVIRTNNEPSKATRALGECFTYGDT